MILNIVFLPNFKNKPFLNFPMNILIFLFNILKINCSLFQITLFKHGLIRKQISLYFKLKLNHLILISQFNKKKYKHLILNYIINEYNIRIQMII